MGAGKERKGLKGAGEKRGRKRVQGSQGKVGFVDGSHEWDGKGSAVAACFV